MTKQKCWKKNSLYKKSNIPHKMQTEVIASGPSGQITDDPSLGLALFLFDIQQMHEFQ